jgi:cell division protein FtsB
MFPKMEMDEHRADRKEIEQRIAELEKQLADYVEKQAGA